MTLRGFAPGILGIASAALFAALPAAAKEGVEATLRTSIPLDAPAGTQVKVAWTLAYIDENGQRQPFGANGVFVRLLSASGADSEEGVAPMGAHPTGEYEATVIVPDGGIGDVEIGLRGWTSGPTGTRRSDALFPITNDPVGVARVASPAGSTTWRFLLVAGLLSVLSLIGVAVARR